MLHGRKPIHVLHDDVGAGERRRRIAARELELMADVRAGPRPQGRQIREVAGRRLARVDQRGPRSQRLLERHRSRERLVVDVDQLERLLGRRLVDGRDRRHRLALVPRDPDREHRPVAICRAVVGIAPGQIGAGERGEDAGPGAGARHVDARDPRVGVRRAEHLRVSHARHGQVGDVARAAGDFLDRVDARHRMADDAERSRAHRAVSAAARTASTIFR